MARLITLTQVISATRSRDQEVWINPELIVAVRRIKVKDGTPPITEVFTIAPSALVLMAGTAPLIVRESPEEIVRLMEG